MEGRSYANGFKKCKFYSVCLNNDNYNYNLFFFSHFRGCAEHYVSKNRVLFIANLKLRFAQLV